MTLRRSPLRRKPPVDHRSEPGYREWHEPVYGSCAICGVGPQRLVRHHVVREADVRAMKGDPWDLRNSILIGAGYECGCHRLHHACLAQIPYSRVPMQAREFAFELYGDEPGALYLARFYSPD